MRVIRATQDSRIRFASGELPVALADQLRGLCEHSNQHFWTMKRLRLPTYHESPIDRTWECDCKKSPSKCTCGALSFPRGVLPAIQKLVQMSGYAFRVADMQERGLPLTENMVYQRALRVYQVAAIEKMMAAGGGILRAPTGCLSGDTKISINRGGKGYTLRLDELVKKQRHMAHATEAELRKRAAWDKRIETKIRARLDDGTIGLIRLLDAYESGVREVFQLKTADGYKIRATADHRFLTNSGWRRLGEIGIGDYVWVEPSLRPVKKAAALKKPKQWYHVTAARMHPYAGRRNISSKSGGGFTVPTHRLVAEARINRIPFDEYVRRVNVGELDGLVFLNPKEFAVHHIDENARNNAPENLAVLTHREHNQVHNRQAQESIAIRAVLSWVVGIERVGMEPTYDLSCEAPNNFIANGFVAHNSGKTSILIALAAHLSVRSLVVVHSSALLRQWQERVRAELGVEPGLVQGSKSELRPVTIAMQKTLWSRGIDAELAQYFGAILCDEIQFFASKTFREVIDQAPHFYRFGASADQRRKDGKEYLIHDVFGPVVADVNRKDLLDDGFVIPVEVLVYPTETAADWYGVPEDEFDSGTKIDVSRLRKELAADASRNEIALEATAKEAEAGKRVFVMAHEREHCRYLAAALSGAGIPAGLLLGGPESRAEFEHTLAQMRAGTLRVGVGTYQAIGTGLDLPTLDAVVCVTPIASNRQFFGQVVGRACRPAAGKDSARMHYLWDRKIFGKRAVQNICGWNDGPVKVLEGGRWMDAREWRRG